MPRCYPAAVGLAVAAAVIAGASGGDMVTIFDFARGDDLWPSINDGVMGGVSSGEMLRSSSGDASFRGNVSFDNNGGFASVRSRAVVHDLSDYDGLAVRVRGDGKRYNVRLKTDASFDGVSYQVPISPPAGEWTDILIPFDDFEPVYRGRRVDDHPPLDPSRITTFGLLISRQEGPFRIDIASIHAVASAMGSDGS
jgi:monofunctional biosynthetic peptidoglycan transglycosylase